MIAYHTQEGIVVEYHGRHHLLEDVVWDDLFRRDDLPAVLREEASSTQYLPHKLDLDRDLIPPIGRQEVWAAGVTYYRSRSARMEEAEQAGGGTFYDRVYDAPRPELFYKSNADRTVGHGGKVRIRKDSKWNVPEPELTLMLNCHGRIVGYTIGNDMSSRDIEGENPLYLPQAKVYDQSCALGPGVFVTDDPLPADTAIQMAITRKGKIVFEGDTTIDQIKRPLEELAEYLFRETSFPHGAYLMTGTGIVPDSDFTLRSGDQVSITIEPIGTLVNTVA